MNGLQRVSIADALDSLNGSAPSPYPALGQIEDDMGQLGWYGADVGKGRVRIDTAHTQALVGFTRDDGEKTSNMTANVDNEFSAIYLTSLDGRPIADDTIVVTYYNAPNVERLRQHYEGLPAKLASEKIDPRIPWLYNFKLDFRFR